MTSDDWRGTWVLQCYLNGMITYWDGEVTTQSLAYAKHYPTKAEALAAKSSMLHPSSWDVGIGNEP
jgi:hypothetical protein